MRQTYPAQSTGKKLRTILGRGWRFVATGLIVNATLIGLVWLLLEIGVGYVITVTTVYVLGLGWGYTQNRIWSWRSRSNVKRSLLRYLVTYGGVYLAHMGTVTLLVEQTALSPILAILISAATLSVLVFFVLDRLVFGERV